jgi:hypothetical protein
MEIRFICGRVKAKAQARTIKTRKNKYWRSTKREQEKEFRKKSSSVPVGFVADQMLLRQVSLRVRRLFFFFVSIIAPSDTVCSQYLTASLKHFENVIWVYNALMKIEFWNRTPGKTKVTYSGPECLNTGSYLTYGIIFSNPLQGFCSHRLVQCFSTPFLFPWGGGGGVLEIIFHIWINPYLLKCLRIRKKLLAGNEIDLLPIFKMYL